MIGKTINGFTLQRKLGEGGMAEVWYAENEIGKPAAVKILSASLSNNEQIVERFHNEALVMVKLDHPNIRQVYGYGYIDNRHCIVMEYLEGDDLEALLKKGRRFTDEELRKWWNQIISALNYTHSKGIVHRDIKPSNIFLDNWGNVKLLDFGIAKLKESMSMTRTGTMMGTLMYMSPEQVRDTKNIDYRTDIYSLAVTFAQLVSGTAPYDATSSDDYTIRKGIVELPFDLSAVPAAWQGFLAPYLEKDPEMRPALRPFEAVPLSAKPETPRSGGFAIRPTGKEDLQSSSKAEKATVVAETTSAKPLADKPKLVSQRPRREQAPVSPEPIDKPKSKKGLWIGLVVVAVALAVVFIKVKENRETDRYGITLNEAMERLCNCVFQEQETFQGIISIETAKALIVEAFDDDEKLLKKTLIRKAKRLELNRFGLAHSELPWVIDLMEAVYDCQGYEISWNNSASQQNVSFNGHEYVDLGLPSGTLWAICNIGASKPEDYGNYYAWGETKTKSVYNWSTYKYANGAEDKLTKYCNDSKYGNNGFTDNLTTLQSGDDPATANWGSGWQTPSKAQYEELLANTTSQWTTRNGVKGRLFTSKKNGQTLFLPATGYPFDGELTHAGSGGAYWSRSLLTGYPCGALKLYFDSDVCDVNHYGYRGSGSSVRPVRSAR